MRHIITNLDQLGARYDRGGFGFGESGLGLERLLRRVARRARVEERRELGLGERRLLGRLTRRVPSVHESITGVVVGTVGIAGIERAWRRVSRPSLPRLLASSLPSLASSHRHHERATVLTLPSAAPPPPLERAPALYTSERLLFSRRMTMMIVVMTSARHDIMI